MKQINPVYLLIVFTVLVWLLTNVALPERAIEQFAEDVAILVGEFGVFSYVAVVVIYVLCSFFFIPLLIPLNVFCGVLFGPYIGTVVSMLGIVLGCLASTVAVRHVFTGMQSSLEKHAGAQQILERITKHGSIIVIMLRLAFVVPYLWQNLLLAMTSMSVVRLLILTAIGSLPGAAIYCFLGAGLMQTGDANRLAIYLAIPLLLLGLLVLLTRYLQKKYQSS